MTTPLLNEGATVVPGELDESLMECPGENDGRRFKHAWQWVWVGGVWTNRLICKTCGVEREAHRSD